MHGAVPGIEAFWRAWTELRRDAERALATGDWATVPERLRHLVDGIDAALHWEFGPGIAASHALTLSANGNLSRRRVTEAWFRAAPPSDGVWEFHPARPARPQVEIHRSQRSYRVSQLVGTAVLHEHRRTMDLVVHHPSMRGSKRAEREDAAVLLLDAAFGEDGVERSIGAIEVVGTPPPRALSLPELAAKLSGLQALPRAFLDLEGEDANGAASRAHFDCSVKPIDHLDCTEHLCVTLRVARPGRDGLPPSGDRPALDALEAELCRVIPFAYLGHITERGRRDHHFYVPAGHQVELPSTPVGQLAVERQSDPEWEVCQAMFEGVDE